MSRTHMNIGVYKGAAALGAYEKWQEIISQNLAAGSVPGFKKNEIAFNAGDGPISINAEGMGFQRDQQIAKLAVYDFKDPQKLRRLGDGLLAPPTGGEQPQRPERPSILGGFIEGSNVSPMTEMVNLI